MESEFPKEDNPLRGLSELIGNAQLLLSYASNAGISLPTEVIEDIVRTKQFFEGTHPSTQPPINLLEMETRFLQATEALAKAVSPVTVSSLRASQTNQVDNSCWGRFKTIILRSPRQISPADLSVRRYRLLSMIVLLFLLFVQIYWVVGTALVKDINDTNVKIDAARSDFISSKKERDEIRKQLNSTTDYSASNTSSDDTTTQTLNAKMSELSDKNANAEIIIANCETLYEVELEILNKWHQYWKKPYQFLGSLGPKTDKKNNEMGTDKRYKKLTRSIKEASFVLDALQVYVLPILYGLLGAITYVLRTLATQIKDFTYTSETNISFRLRLNLGALCGLIIFWFLKGDDATAESGFSTLSPLAIAFAAGYSVELLFAAMDRFITAFSYPAREKNASKMSD